MKSSHFSEKLLDNCIFSKLCNGVYMRMTERESEREREYLF